MKKKILKSISILLVPFILLIIYLSTVGIETEKFNKQIKDIVKQKNNKFDTSLKKIRLTLDLLNFRINAKTIDAKITFKGKSIELEYIKTQISLNSLIKSQLVTSEIEISTKPILFKNFVSFTRAINNRRELFFLEQFIKKGYLIADLKFNLDNENMNRRLLVAYNHAKSPMSSSAYMPSSDSYDQSIAYFMNSVHLWYDIDVAVRYDNNERLTTGKNYEDSAISFSANSIFSITDSLKYSIGYSHVSRSPNMAELFADGKHGPTNRYEKGDSNLKREISRNIDLGID